MLSISPLKSASGAAKYYLSEENPKDLPDVSLEKDASDNYYLKEKDQGENTFWYGKLAEEAGLLSKAVEQETLESVLSGNLGDETIKGKRDDHKCGLDLTLSVSKGFSIAALGGGDMRLLGILKDAVKFVADEIEKDTAQVTSTNKEGEREYINTGNMIFAAIGHKTSRENDMQLHYHLLAPNMTRDQEGQLRSLASTIKQKGGVINGTSERIYNFQKYYTALFHSKIAHDVERIGYQTHGLGNGQIDISGIPQPLIENSSTRTQQINQQALNFGDTQAARDMAALDTRKSKTYLSNGELTTKWQQQIKEMGYKPEELVKNAQQFTKQEFQPALIAQEALSRAISHLEQNNTALRLEKIVELAVSDFTKGDIQANAIDVKNLADEWIKEGTLIPLAEKGQYTTKGLIDNEKALIDSTQGRAHHMRTHVAPKILDKLAIPESQQRVLTDLYHSTKQFHVVNVHGSSQSIAQQLLNVGNHSGKRVQFVSQSTKAKAEGMESLQRQSKTLGAWIANAFSP
ncbi:MobF family relaxase, partial [Vibrio harveyi]